MIIDALTTILVAFLASALGEGMTYLFVYRTEKYRKLKLEVDRRSKKLERMSQSSSNKSNKVKRVTREEESLKSSNRELSMVKMKSVVWIGITFTTLLSLCNSIFDGRVVARLPFTPIGLLQGISHRNLPGEDYRDCSFIFLYILCTMSFRQNIQKFFGFAPSRLSQQRNDMFGGGAAGGQRSMFN